MNDNDFVNGTPNNQNNNGGNYADGNNNATQGNTSNGFTFNHTNGNFGSQYNANSNPYQYSANNGWQNQPPQQIRQEEYKWNLNDYDDELKQPKKKLKGRKGKAVLMTVSAVLSVALVGFAFYGAYAAFTGFVPQLAASSSSSAAPSASTGDESFAGISVSNKPTDGSGNFVSSGYSSADVAEMVKPSIVGIVAYQQNSYEAAGGSGIIIREDGYIVTNAHVVNGSVGIKVVLDNGEEYEGVIKGMDTDTDLAVIKIEAKNLTYAKFGNSDQIKVGEEVLAIGNPTSLLLSGSVSRGIVSGVNRAISTDTSITMNYIQTDAAINPGNSGGALVNSYGQVIGINTLKTTDTEGIGFAIPINQAKPIIDDLMKYGRVTGRGKLGITGVAIDLYQARMMGLPVTGILVRNTEQGSDIANKKVLPGDIITKINDKSITAFTDLKDELVKHKSGDSVKLTIFRRTSGQPDRTFEVTVTLGEDKGK